VLEDQPKAGTCLFFRVGAVTCALPVGVVVETMRPLPVQPLAQAPAAVMGLAMIRGLATPVLDLARLLGTGALTPTPSDRFITVAIGDRRVALAVSAVTGLRAVSAQELEELPPLLAQAETGAVSAIGALDQGLLMLLRAAHLVPEATFAALPLQAGAS
jgi:purine-binding chemotaxis protein CheW